ncbi:MAG: response regulator [Porphyromonadaceae bacterium]|nr:MAG: response regulator [Porphyromonadaceae bacterium]
MLQSLNVEKTILLKKKILIVDDYPPTRQLIRDALSQTGDYEISEAENGAEAVDQCRWSTFDLVISDVMMPGVGGMELLTRLREMSPDTSVIMITAHPAVDLTVSAMKKGAVDFLKKPFNIDNLLYKVKSCLDEKELSAEVGPKQGGSEAKIADKTKDLSVQGFIYESFENIEGDSEYVFRKIVDLSMNIVDGDECALLLFDEEERAFHPKILKSPDRDVYEKKTIPALSWVFQQVADEKRALMIHSTERPEIAPSLICAPLMIRSNVFGILCIRRKGHLDPFTAKDLHYVVSLTRRASLNLENTVLYESVYNNVLDTFKSLLTSIQARDHYTEEHCSRVAGLSVTIAKAMHCNTKEVESLKIAAMLHDIGKIAIPDKILLKPARLTFEEFTFIKAHTEVGYRILQPMFLLDQERNVLLHHHERWDGKGYPEGLTGPGIPFLSRILAVADSFDAMTNNRPYRSAIDISAALEKVKKNSGLQFDERVVEAFLTLFS